MGKQFQANIITFIYRLRRYKIYLVIRTQISLFRTNLVRFLLCPRLISDDIAIQTLSDDTTFQAAFGSRLDFGTVGYAWFYIVRANLQYTKNVPFSHVKLRNA